MNTNPSDARKVPLVEQLERIPIDEVLRWTEQDGLCPSHSMPVGALAHTAAATIRNDRERISQLEQLVERKDEALRAIADYKWPVSAGTYKEKFFGEATGNEYYLTHHIPRETASGALESIRTIARAALGGSE